MDFTFFIFLLFLVDIYFSIGKDTKKKLKTIKK